MKQSSFPFDNIVTIIGFLALTLTLTLLTRPSGVVEGLKHNYYTKRDERSLIGPLGFPFGFLDTGHYNLTVFDFQLSVPKKRHKHDQHRLLTTTNRGDSSSSSSSSSSRSAAADNAADASMLSDVLNNIKGAGFLLKQFEDEAAFNHYIAQVNADPSYCVFQKYIDLKEAEQMDDILYDDQDDFTYYADDDYDYDPSEYDGDDYAGGYGYDYGGDDGVEVDDEDSYPRRVLKWQQSKRQQRSRQSQKQLNNNRILVADGGQEGEEEEEEDQGYGEVIDAVQDGIYLDMLPRSRWRPNSPTVAYNFEAGQAGFYFLIYQVCYKDEPPAENNQNNNYLDIHSRFELDFLFSNIDMYAKTKM